MSERLEEIWKRINGYEEYEISNLGRVKSFKHDRKGKIMKPKFSGEYLAVTLCADGQQERKTIHRLVAEHFIPNPSGLPWVNHKDGNKLNNKVTNLEWVTPSENNNHAYKIGLKKGVKGEKHGRSKLNEIDVITIYHLAKSEVIPIKKIANKFGVTFQTVSDIKLEKRWKHLTNPQAERVQELEKQNKRYREVLKNIYELAEYDEYDNTLEQIVSEIEKALESDEN
jgi:NUMOD4 motif/HNH endonuclease